MSQPPLLHTIAIGDTQVTLIQDGELSVPVAELLPDVPADVWTRHLTDAGEGMVRLSLNLVLVRADDEVILIDTGLGAAQGGGAVLPALTTLGLTPDDITRVVITHTDGDHIGGALTMANDEVRPNFRHARHHLARADWDWVQRGDDPEFDLYRQMLALLPATTLDAPNEQITPSLRAIDAAGHTPGHRAIAVESAGQVFCFLGDLVHVPAVQFATPDRVTAWDIQPELTPASRRRLAAQAVAGDWRLGVAHAVFPGLGRLTANGADGWTWQPLER